MRRRIVRWLIVLSSALMFTPITCGKMSMTGAVAAIEPCDFLNCVNPQFVDPCRFVQCTRPGFTPTLGGT
jgi:hypothetical protein